MTELQNKIVAEARQWIGTRWGHQKMIKGVQCDCAGMIRGTLEAVVGLKYDDIWDYGHRPDAPTLISILNKYFIWIPAAEAAPGDIMLFKIDGNPQHLAIRTDKGIIHAYAAGPKRVEEVSFAPPWTERLVGVWRISEKNISSPPRGEDQGEGDPV
jgi:NlpC/P60 family putative phage cell wall peptidase